MRRVSLTLLLLSIPVLNSAFAQNVPPGQQAGVQAQRFKEESLLKKESFEQKIPRAVEMAAPEKPSGTMAESVSFVLQDIVISGSTTFEAWDLKPEYASYLGKKITFKELNLIVGKIEARYKAKGYLTTIAFLPKQSIKDGVVEIQVAEGNMGNLIIEGDKRALAMKDLVEKYFHTLKYDLFNINTLQRDLLRLNQNSDMQFSSTLAPGKTPQTTDVILKVKSSNPYHGGFRFDNQGSRSTGKLRESCYFHSSNVSGHFDSFFANIISSTNTLGESFSYTLPMGTYGTKFGIDITHFKMKIGKEFKPYHIRGETQIYTPHVSWELALKEDFQATFETGLDIKSITQETNYNKSSDDQLRIPYFELNLMKSDPYGQTTFNPKVSFGTSSWWGSSVADHSSASRLGSGGTFVKYLQSLGRVEKMPFESYLSVRSQFQASSQTLPSSEQFQIGGANSVRGYPEGDYVADWGGNLSADWVMPMYLIPKEWKLLRTDMPLRNFIEPVLFFDIGGGSIEKTMPGERKYKFLMGTGFGLRLQYSNDVSLKLDYGFPVGNKPTSGVGPANLYVTLQVNK